MQHVCFLLVRNHECQSQSAQEPAGNICVNPICAPHCLPSTGFSPQKCSKSSSPSKTRWWQLKYFISSPLFGGRWTQFDSYFSDGLVQPPTRNTGEKQKHLNNFNGWETTPRWLTPLTWTTSWIPSCSHQRRVKLWERTRKPPWNAGSFRSFWVHLAGVFFFLWCFVPGEMS